MAKGPTKAEREAKEYERERVLKERFLAQLAGLKSYAEALEFVAKGATPTDPSRPFYSNLGWFLGTFDPPGNASAQEKRLYIELLKRMDAAGELKQGVLEAKIECLQKSIDERPWDF